MRLQSDDDDDKDSHTVSPPSDSRAGFGEQQGESSFPENDTSTIASARTPTRSGGRTRRAFHNCSSFASSTHSFRRKTSSSSCRRRWDRKNTSTPLTEPTLASPADDFLSSTTSTPPIPPLRPSPEQHLYQTLGNSLLNESVLLRDSTPFAAPPTSGSLPNLDSGRALFLDHPTTVSSKMGRALECSADVGVESSPPAPTPDDSFAFDFEMVDQVQELREGNSDNSGRLNSLENQHQGEQSKRAASGSRASRNKQSPWKELSLFSTLEASLLTSPSRQEQQIEKAAQHRVQQSPMKHLLVDRQFSSVSPRLTNRKGGGDEGKKIRASTARFILWIWTLVGLVTTSGLILYQSTYLDQFLLSQHKSSSLSDERPLAATSRGRRYLDASTLRVTRHQAPRYHGASQQRRRVLSPDELLMVSPPPIRKDLAQHVYHATETLRQSPLYHHHQVRHKAIHFSLEQESARRLVSLDGRSVRSHSEPHHRPMALYPATYTDQTQLYGVLDSDDPRVSGMEQRPPLADNECVPMHEWQTTFHPSCNEVHAMGLEQLGDAHPPAVFNLFGRKGYWRNAWRADVLTLATDDQGTLQPHNDTIVLKTLKMQHNFEEAHFEHDRIDAVAMERLTASQHVINIFGFCGHSVVTEYADGKRLGTLADKSKKTPLARLRIARDIAEGLADVHGIDADKSNVTSFVHLDINPANVVSIGGTLKLNDFNIGILRKWNVTSNKTGACGFQNHQYPNPQWRSPEEARNENNLTEKVDVFSMGHILYRLICGHEPWNKLEPGGKPSKAHVTEAVQQGILPTIPSQIMESHDDEIVAIRQAMLSCYTSDPAKRPTARHIATQLQAELDRLQGLPAPIV